MFNAQLAASFIQVMTSAKSIYRYRACTEINLSVQQKTERDLTIIYEYTTCSKGILLNFWLTSSTMEYRFNEVMKRPACAVCLTALTPFAREKHRKSRSSVFRCSLTPRKRLLRRLCQLENAVSGHQQYLSTDTSFCPLSFIFMPQVVTLISTGNISFFTKLCLNPSCTSERPPYRSFFSDYPGEKTSENSCNSIWPPGTKCIRGLNFGCR